MTTCCNAIIEVSEAIINNLWQQEVSDLFPSNIDEFKSAMVKMGSEWQFSSGFCALDGSHIPIKCPLGGPERRKEYYNYKKFYSVVLMSMVNAEHQFIWSCCGSPGNDHDSTVFQSTAMFDGIVQGNKIPNIASMVGDKHVPPLILGDGAFPFKYWLMKPFSHADKTPMESYFNYRLSRSRMVSECAFGKLKGRWRVLFKTCESTPETVKLMTLACIVLHNICHRLGDTIFRQWDASTNPATQKRWPSDVVRNLLKMEIGTTVRDNNVVAGEIRKAIMKKFWKEKTDKIIE